jgi:hypothetical protein
VYPAHWVWLVLVPQFFAGFMRQTTFPVPVVITQGALGPVRGQHSRSSAQLLPSFTPATQVPAWHSPQ